VADWVLYEQRGKVAVITLNRPEVLNAWHAPMRNMLSAALSRAEGDAGIGAIVLTGSGDRAFSAGQDFEEARTFDPRRAEEWVGEWEALYDLIRRLSKPLVAALNGVAAGSAFQIALLTDVRVGHPGVRMGQPEINAGIASTTGPWIMREHLGLARTIELTLTGRLMEADECKALGLLAQVVPPERVLDAAIDLAEQLSGKPPVAMRLDKQRFREMTEAGFRDCLEAGQRIQHESYASGEPARMMDQFLARRSTAQSAA